MRRHLIVAFFLAPALLVLPQAVNAVVPGAAPADVRTDIEALFSDCRYRAPGSAGNLVLEEKVAQRFAASGFRNGEIAFPVPVLEPGKTFLTVAGETPARVLPMHPTVMRPGNFPERQFTTGMVYLGRCTPADLQRLDGVPLAGTVGLVEFDCGTRWQRWLRFGFVGFVFIGVPEHTHFDAVGKVYNTEVNVPRFYIGGADGDRLREYSRTPVSVTVSSEPSRWRNRTLRDLWVLVPGQDARLQQEVAVVTAPIDSNCVVPELAEGAQAGANLYLLLRLLDAFAKDPPERSVMLVAVNAHTQAFAGDRMLAWHLLFPDYVRDQYREHLNNARRVQELYLSHYRKLNLSPPTADDEEFLVSMRTLTDGSAGKLLRVKKPIVGLAKRDKNVAKAEKLRRTRQDAEPDPQQMQAIETRLQHIIRVLSLFNKVGVRTTVSELDDEELTILRRYVAETVQGCEERAELNRTELIRLDANDAVRDAVAGRRLSFVWTLDLTWTGRRLGFASAPDFQTGAWSHEWGAAMQRLAAGLKDAGTDDLGRALLVDTMTSRGGLSEAYYWNDSGFAEVLQSLQLARPTAAFAVRDVFTEEGVAFTPDDTFARLDTVTVARFSLFLTALLRATLADPGISALAQVALPNTKRWQPIGIQLRTFMFDPFAATSLPELPLPETFIMVNGLGAQDNSMPLAGETVRTAIGLTDARAAVGLLGVCRLRLGELYTSALHFDKDFTKVDHALDVGDVEKRLASNINSAVTDHTMALFECREVPVYERTDLSRLTDFPRQIDLHVSYKLLVGALNDPPRKFGFGPGVICAHSAKDMMLSRGPAAFYFEPAVRFKLMAGACLALNASAAPDGSGQTTELGRGYADAADLGPDIIRRSTHDTAILNRFRTGRFHGFQDSLVDYYLRRGTAALARSDNAFSEHRHVEARRALYEATGAERMAYERIAYINNDMLKVIIFYMALMLPFCFFLQRLLFSFTRIEAQMVAFLVLFCATYVLFRNIHPAFRIAQSPEAIFVAFVMAVLGLFVMWVLHTRFEGEMQLLLSGMSLGASGDPSTGNLSTTAMLLGVSNMKRRRMRTVLTLVTILLVTFTMLAFTSVSTRMNPTLIPRAGDVPYTGIMHHWRSTEAHYENVVAALGDILQGRGVTLVRRWLLPGTRLRKSRSFHVATASGRNVEIEAFLGMDAREDGFIRPMPMLAGRFFKPGEREVAVLPSQTARALRIEQDDLADAVIFFRGYRLEVVGILDEDAFRRIKDLDGRSLLPVKPSPMEDVSHEDASNAPEKDDSDLYYVSTASMVLLPVDLVEELGGGPASISVKLPLGAESWPLLDELLTVTDGHYYMGSDKPFRVSQTAQNETRSGLYYIGAGHSTAIGGMARLLIPLLIACTIIFNTMLGSVYERKPEIAIYNAVGINPTQVFIFFLAEALVYGVIGAVGGYLIGQLCSIGLSHVPIFAGISLNFSTLKVLFVITGTIGIVLLSTLYPAYVATRTATPSGKREWSLPKHDGQRMQLTLPFIYHENLGLGVVGYLHEYFANFGEATIGNLIASLQSFDSDLTDSIHPTHVLRYHIALAPFDLGVTQQFTIRVVFNDVLRTYQMHFQIDRESGQDVTWASTNRPFLTKLRKYLMAWRDLSELEHALYIDLGRELQNA